MFFLVVPNIVLLLCLNLIIINQNVTMAVTVKPKNKTASPVKSKSVNLRLLPTLHERGMKYAQFSGLSITALLRNGLDELLRKNNF